MPLRNVGLLLGSIHVSKELHMETIMLSSIPSTKSHHMSPKDYSGWLVMVGIE
jgi:hypothetical protein